MPRAKVRIQAFTSPFPVFVPGIERKKGEKGKNVKEDILSIY
jgi:hypothetical protein